MFKPAAEGQPRVLVVDDHAISRRYLTAALRESMSAVKCVACARDAIEVALHWLPDAILMDVELGGANGYDVAFEIRTRWPPCTPQPRILMLSAEPAHSGDARAHGTASDGFLPKPVSVEKLTDSLTSRCAPNPGGEARVVSELQQLFRAELTSQLDTLDTCVSRQELTAAQGVLHQLIASAAICGQSRLERQLRALNAVCRERAGKRRLAQAYFSLLTEAGKFLAQGRPRTGA